MSDFRKTGDPRATAFEVAGLSWLADAGGAPVVPVTGAGEGWLTTRRLEPGRPDALAAERFGRALAATHAAGAGHLGCPPPGWAGPGFMGRAALPFRGPGAAWGEFYAADRILPYLEDAVANGSVDEAGAAVVHRLADRLAAGDLDHPQPAGVPGAARLHGDLWSGNVVWARTGADVVATVIDPAAQGGHAESDLAQLGVFAGPHTDRVVAAYDEVSPLADGWRGRVGLHRLHILVVHAALFGGSYGAETVATARRYL